MLKYTNKNTKVDIKHQTRAVYLLAHGNAEPEPVESTQSWMHSTGGSKIHVCTSL